MESSRAPIRLRVSSCSGVCTVTKSARGRADAEVGDRLAAHRFDLGRRVGRIDAEALHAERIQRLGQPAADAAEADDQHGAAADVLRLELAACACSRRRARRGRRRTAAWPAPASAPACARPPTARWPGRRSPPPRRARWRPPTSMLSQPTPCREMIFRSGAASISERGILVRRTHSASVPGRKFDQVAGSGLSGTITSRSSRACRIFMPSAWMGWMTMTRCFMALSGSRLAWPAPRAAWRC